LIPSTVKNVEDICAAARIAIVDQVFPCRETLHTASDVACGLARIWMFSEQPETLHDSINYQVCRFQACSTGPIEEDLIKILLSISETR